MSNTFSGTILNGTPNILTKPWQIDNICLVKKLKTVMYKDNKAYLIEVLLLYSSTCVIS